MKKKEMIFLTEVVTVLSEKGEKRLNKVNAKTKSDDDEGGMPLEWYLENNLKPPKHLKEQEDEYDSDGYIELKEGEFAYEFVEIIVDLQRIYKVTNVDDFGSILELDNGEAVRIEENVEDVFFIISYAQRGWFEKLKESVFTFFRRIIGKNRVDLQELVVKKENHPENKQ